MTKEYKKDEVAFKPRARIMLQLGEQLIKNESIALLELLKNSYDADASHASVIMENIETPESGKIIIEDDGVGMNFETVQNIWMEPGSDNKEKLVEKAKRSKIYNRLPLGEKGIGRFGAHKLGTEIELIARSADRPEVYLYIDWKKFENVGYLSDISVKISERAPEYFTGKKTGTRIVIKNLRNPWTRGMIRDIHRSMNSLCSPFSGPGNFAVQLNLKDNDEWLKDLVTWKEIKKFALYHASCTINSDEITKFKYHFTPWESMDKLEPREVTENDIYFQKLCKMVHTVDEKSIPLDLSLYEIGEIKFDVYIFDRTPKVLLLGVQDKKGFKEYLDQNGGVRVYRDGVRVYDYGEPGNDWLNLDLRRVNVPTKRVSNNILLGAIHISRKSSRSLIEKTNREGFIDNDAYQHFTAAILYALGIIEKFRNPDKEKLQNIYGPTPKSEPVTSSLASLRKVVEDNIKESPEKKEILKYIGRIENDYQEIRETLLKSAGAGLGLSMVIHEIEKISSELIKVLEKTRVSERVLYLARHLSQVIEGYSQIIRGSGIKQESLAGLIDQALFNVEFRIRAHNIDLVLDYDKPISTPKVKCARRFVINNIMQIIDNSIWWLNYYNIKNKKIFITITEEKRGYTSIIMADNGKGFSLPTEDITKPFVSGKPEDAGMGIGLHIVDETMTAQKGLLLFPEPEDFTIPEEFKKGAITALCFKN